MSTLLTGTIFKNTAWPVAGYTPALFGCCIRSDETFAYVTDINANARVYSYLLSNPWTVTQINTDGLLVAPRGIAISPDNNTLYILCFTGELFSMPVATGIPTLIGSVRSIAQGTGCQYLDYDVVGNQLLCGGTNIKGVVAFDLNTMKVIGTGVYYWSSFFNNAQAVNSIFTDRYWIALQNTIAGLGGNNIVRQFRDPAARMEIMGGDGQSLSSSGTALTSSTTGVLCMAVDNNERVYWYAVDGGSNNLRYIDGTNMQILVASAASAKNMRFLPIANQLFTVGATAGILYS